MREVINQRVSVICYFNANKRSFRPHLISWKNKDYKIGKIGFHHIIKSGDVRHHIYECIDAEQTIWFRLNFNTKSLNWFLEVVSDGLAY